MVQVALASSDKVSEILDLGLTGLNTALAQSIESGAPLLINLGMLAPDFNRVYTHREIFPSNLIFDWPSLQIQQLQQKLLRCSGEHLQQMKINTPTPTSAFSGNQTTHNKN